MKRKAVIAHSVLIWFVSLTIGIFKNLKIFKKYSELRLSLKHEKYLLIIWYLKVSHIRIRMPEIKKNPGHRFKLTLI